MRRTEVIFLNEAAIVARLVSALVLEQDNE
jgi:hypothetical protein